MKTILVLLDGSEQTEHGLAHARLLAPLLDARVCLLRVIPAIEQNSFLADSITGYYEAGLPPERYRERSQHAWEELEQQAEHYLAGHAAALRQAGIAAEVDVRSGSAADAIIASAEQLPADLIIVAAPPGAPRHWPLGSMAERIVHATAASVLIIRGSGLV